MKTIVYVDGYNLFYGFLKKYTMNIIYMSFGN